MGSWWRSEEMVYISLIVTEEAAISCIRELGTLGCIQFVDLNPDLTPFQRDYVSNIKRCDEIERKIRYVADEVKRLGISISSNTTVEDFIADARADSADSTSGSGAYILENLENKLDTFEQQLRGLVDYNSQLSEQYTRKVEYHHLLVQAHRIIRAVSEIDAKGGLSSTSIGQAEDSESVVNPLLTLERGDGATSGYQDSVLGIATDSSDLVMSFSNVSGVIKTQDRSRFERMLFRSTRGNCYVRFAPLSSQSVANDADGNVIEKLCFVIFYKSATIETKIIRICDAFGATRYDLNMLNSPRDLEEVRRANYQELLDSKAVLDKNTAMRHGICAEVASNIENWFWVVRREKSVYHTLNLFKADVAGRLMRARGWVTQAKVGAAKAALHRAHLMLNLPQNALIERVNGKWPTPPTHFVVNKYTYAYQEFVNTFGVPRYREANPALFTAATFPFLFGIMYGDIGHGVILTVAALYLVLTESKVKNNRSMDEMVKAVYSARFMLLGMGCCAVYAGLIYNDYFSLGLNLFGTRYTFKKSEDELVKGDRATFVDNLKYGNPDTVYPVGLDPVWHVSDNSLQFFNGMKMKMSVILGIAQMTIGIMLRGINSFYLTGYGLDFLAEFLPMIIFDVGFFGYMVLLIFIKWGINWDERMALGSCQYDNQGNFGACNLSTANFCYTPLGDKCDADTPLVDVCPLDYGGTGDGCQPPDLITTLINIVLKPGQVDDPMYPGQEGVQTFLLLVSFITVPWLLCVKPYVLYKQHKAEKLEGSAHGAGMSLLDDVSEHDQGYADGSSNPLHGLGDIELSTFGTPSFTHLDIDTDRARSDSVTSQDSMIGGSSNDVSYLPGGGGFDEAAVGHHGDGEEFQLGEIIVHQGIETIEFVLGMVSNTASYLRLWALSLAHTELAEVFWEKVMVGAIEGGNPVGIFVAFYIFMGATTGVLLFMDVLECFLHALRLHWVEFQNKFYKGDGIRFVPFDFMEILSRSNID